MSIDYTLNRALINLAEEATRFIRAKRILAENAREGLR